MLAAGEGGRGQKKFFGEVPFYSVLVWFKVSFYTVFVRFFGLVRGRQDVARTPCLQVCLFPFFLALTL